MNEIRSGYYRVSVKALILNETRDKFLIVHEDNGRWDLPGGGLDWGEDAHEGLRREIHEEMGLVVTHIETHPSYFLTSTNMWKDVHVANVIYEATPENLDFTSTPECTEIKFVDAEELKNFELVIPNVQAFAEMFDPRRHAR